MISSIYFPLRRFHHRHILKFERWLSLNSLPKCQECIIKSPPKSYLEQSDYIGTESPYYFENGLRKIYPYYFTYTTYCKGRWFKREFQDIYTEEFGLYPKSDVESRILSGKILVNGNIVGLDYKLKDGDFISSKVHRHELAVLAAPINVIHEDENLLIVDKPPSIPVHPCGLYRYNTILFILQLEGKWKDLKVVHRLDRLTSGVLILSKNSKMSNKIQVEMNDRNWEKEYVCRVEGNFPDGKVICDKPIRKVYTRMGVSLICPTGKKSMTEFQKLSYNGKSSVVLCKPLTGRTHQIRVHLQYLGHPIVNDPLYNSFAFGPDKGKNGDLHKSVEQLLQDLKKEHFSDWWLDTADSSAKTDVELESSWLASNFNLGVFENYRNNKDESRVILDEHCSYCQKSFREPKQTNLFQFLHAYKYRSKTWEFKTEMPKWALSDWNLM